MHSTILVISGNAHDDPWDVVAQELEPFAVAWEELTSNSPQIGWWDQWADTTLSIPFDCWRVESRIGFGHSGVVVLQEVDRVDLERRLKRRLVFAAVLVSRTWFFPCELTGDWAHMPVRVSAIDGQARVVAFNESDEQWAILFYGRFIRQLSAGRVLIAVDLHH